MSLLSPIGKNKFSFYIVIYIFLLFIIKFLLFSKGINFSNLTELDFNGNKIISIGFFILILSLGITIIKRIKDLKKYKTIIILIYLLGFGIFLIPYDIFFSFKNIYIAFLILFNPIFPLGIILFLLFKSGKTKENFDLKLITNKIFGAFFFNKKLKEKIINNKFLVGVYKYLFYALLFGFFILLFFIKEEGELFTYKGYENYSSKIGIEQELYKNYLKSNIIINKYKKEEMEYNKLSYIDKLLYDEFNKKTVSIGEYENEKRKIYNNVKIELESKRNGINPLTYIYTLIYLIFAIITLKISPYILMFLYKLLYIIKLPFSIVYLYTKKTISKLEDIEKNLKNNL